MRAASIVIGICLGVVSGACSSAGTPSPESLGDDPNGAAPPAGAVSEPCTDGAVETCKTAPVTHDGVTSCGIGVRACQKGQWGPCGGEANGTTIQSFTFTATCTGKTSPVWTEVTYDGATPSNASGASSITLHVQTADSRHPTVLQPDRPLPVNNPKDLSGALGGHRGDVLVVRAVLAPTPDGALRPALGAIQPTYDCK